MEIFIVEVSKVHDGEIWWYDPKAYSTMEKAEKDIKETRKCWERAGWTIEYYYDDFVEAYKEGYGHIEAIIKILEVI